MPWNTMCILLGAAMGAFVPPLLVSKESAADKSLLNVIRSTFTSTICAYTSLQFIIFYDYSSQIMFVSSHLLLVGSYLSDFFVYVLPMYRDNKAKGRSNFDAKVFMTHHLVTALVHLPTSHYDLMENEPLKENMKIGAWISAMSYIVETATVTLNIREFG